MNEYITIKAPCERELIIKKSRFIGQLYPVSSFEEAQEKLAEVKKKYWDATHNCSALIVGERGEYTRCSDDGEPQGTAGVPMLEALKNTGLTNVLCVVTRYFGGILLGAGGLVRAYSQGAAAALNACGVGVMHPTARYLMEIPYPMLNRMDHFLKGEPVIVEDKDYTDKISYTLIVRCADEEGFLSRVTDMSEGRVEPLRVEEMYLPWPEEDA